MRTLAKISQSFSRQPAPPRGVRWKTKSMRELKAHDRVDEVEAEGMDEGRIFVHLTPGWKWADMARFTDQNIIEHSRSFGGAIEALREVKAAVPCMCEGCTR